MYLKSIKLAGFKSFVDPVTIALRNHMNAIVGPNGCGKSNINAIVGPNGCGKSNIVDAIRWVIGESSAKQLRGQSMSDVIFNGTTQRKAVGRAMVELHFDNSTGRIGGEYAQYNEIMVRREVERDGQSRYYLNGASCRRRDILDVFLGTGLGSRSYSIIEQGMISQLIEAKPEDLRVHLEEVAGISKYRERRRETENRIRHTQENLDRLNDIREELDKQLRHLKRQANAAASYKTLRAEERTYAAQVKALNWQTLENRRLAQQEKINHQVAQLEQQTAQQHEFEAQIAVQQVAAEEAAVQHQTIQKNYYCHGEEIARLEQQIQSHQQQIQTWQEELITVEQTWESLQEAVVEYREQSQTLGDELEALSPQGGQVERLSGEAAKTLAAAEDAMQHWQAQWEASQRSLFAVTNQTTVTHTRVEHQQQQQQKLQIRQEEVVTQLAALPLEQLRASLQPQQEAVNVLQQELQARQQQLQQEQQAIGVLRTDNQQRDRQIQQARQSLQVLESEQAKLSALQQAALGCNNEDSQQWLSEQKLGDALRLGQQLKVKNGWEKAVETVLSGYFDVLCVDDMAQYAESLAQLNAGRVTLLETSSVATVAVTSAELLLNQVEQPCAAAQWLQGIYIAQTLSAAMQLRSQLALHESVITPDGVWIGKNWMRVSKVDDPQSGVIERGQRLEALAQQIAAAAQQLQGLLDAQQDAAEQLLQCEEARDQMQTQVQVLTRQLAAANTELQKQAMHLENTCAKQQRLQQEADTIAAELAHCEQIMQQLAEKTAELDQQRATLEKAHEALSAQRDQHQQTLVQCRDAFQQKKQQADEYAIRVSATESQLAVLTQSVSRDEKQLAQLAEKRDYLRNNLDSDDSPLERLKQTLQQKLAVRLEVEHALETVSQHVNTIRQQLKTAEQKRQQALVAITDMQSQLDGLRMSAQEFAVRQQTINEQLQDEALVLQEILDQLPEEATIDLWQERLEGLARRIQRLGAINLAAIDEYETGSERKQYLDQQFDDLTQALETLQAAIRKIDRESKIRFQETFDKVNSGFQTIFPQVFGGGRANLELSDDDLLTTGVLVKAQPPGKRNASIHMLSGGEKALTAISLIFAMFQLNPAPFCILDEVDAPLGDLNVGRFCQLVKQMSSDTQFLIISHNKNTIEKADHLLGVTMQEAGVSRLVAVDVQEALEMVET